MTNKRKLRFGMIFLGPFPEGNVSTIRIFSYCKSLAKSGYFVKIYLLAPTKEAGVNKDKVGKIDGVEYEYLSKITWSSDNVHVFVKGIYYLYGIFRTLFKLNKDNITCLLSYHNEFLFNLLIAITTKIYKIPFILDKTEYPKYFKSNNRFLKYLEKKQLSLYDGIMTITKELQSYYKNLLQKPIFLLPMTVDSDRYLNQQRTDQEYSYIATVFGTHNRDSLIDAVKAYLRYLDTDISKKHYRLFLIGDFDKLCFLFPENNEIINLIKQNKDAKESIVFKGLVSSNDIPHILINAKCLLTTPRFFNSGGFPTKLGEYLLSGVPVISTSVGEIPEYLTDKINVFLSPPGEVESICRNIIYIHNHYEDALKIGENGKQLAKKHFNADNYIEDIIQFVKEL